jgi:Na+/proline symporter
MVGGYRAVVGTDVFQGIIVGLMVFLPVVISPRPNLEAVWDTRFLSIEVLLIFLASFALTITRPELWQRIYSAASGHKAAQSLRFAALLFFVLCCFILYYAFAVVQSLPDLSPDQAFAVGYRKVLPPIIAAIFSVTLLAAMMSSLDSASFLLSVDLASLRKKTRKKRILWSRIYIVIILVASGVISLTIFDALTFAYKINGIVALFTVPLLMSFWLKIPDILLGTGLLMGLTTYMILLLIGRIDRNPVESILAGLITGIILLLGYWIKRFLHSLSPSAFMK